MSAGHRERFTLNKFNFITIGNTASLLVEGKAVIHNLNKQELFKLFAVTEDAINKVEESERNSRIWENSATERDQSYENKEWVNFGAIASPHKAETTFCDDIGSHKGNRVPYGWEFIDGTDVLSQKDNIPAFESCLAE